VNGEKAIRRSTVAAVVLVAAVAAVASYEHAYTVIAGHGEHGTVARIYPLTIDGLIYAASMVLMSAARRGVPAPALARWALAAGITATLAANVLAGIAYGLLGAIVAAWPAPALVISYELLMHLVRSAAAADAHPDAPATAVTDAPDAVPDAVPDAPAASSNGSRTHGRTRDVATEAAAERRYADAPLPSIRQIQREMHVGAGRARVLREHLAALAGTK